MKILMVCEYYYPHIGGVEIVFQNIAERLVKLGHDVDLVTSKVENSLSFEIINGVKIHRVFVPQTADRYFFSFFAIPKILKLAKNADIIQTTLYTAAFPSWLARIIYKKKTILMVHEIFGERWQELFDMSFLSAFVHQLLEKALMLLKFDKYVAVSESTKKDLLEYKDADKCIKIFNGINPIKNYLPDNFDKDKHRESLGINKEFVYLFFGRPGISKGLEYLLYAAPKIKTLIPNSKLFLVLNKNPYSGYQKAIEIINRLNISENIKLFESMPFSELIKIIKISDCAVIPSLSEGFGFAAAESCMLGSPVVVSNAGSLPEVVFGKVVFTEAKNPDSIAEGVYKAYQGKFEEIPNKNFNWDKTVEEYLRLYEELIRNYELRITN